MSSPDARDLNADAESESAARRGVFRGGGESDRVSSTTLKLFDRNDEKAFEDGKVSNALSVAAILHNDENV